MEGAAVVADTEPDSVFFDENSDVLKEDESTFDEMKIQTMYKMVEDVTVSVLGREVQKKVLYLTNKQAVLFDEPTEFERCIEALDIGEPKFVIKIVPSMGNETQMMIAHEESVGGEFTEFNSGEEMLSSELDDGDERIVDTEVILFMRTCIIPLAKQTRALIMISGANDCCLSAALAQVAVSEQARLGKDCPFVVIATCSEYEVHSRAISAKDAHTIAGQVSRDSRSWFKRVPFMHDALKKWNMELQRCDLSAAASRYIIFESVDENGSKNLGPKTSFESAFLQALIKKVPSIAIHSHQMDSSKYYLTELLARKVPVLLIDTTERAFTSSKLIGRKTPNTKLAKEADAFPYVSDELFNKVKNSPDSLDLSVRLELFEIAEQMIERKMICLKGNHVVDKMSTALYAFIHNALMLGAKSRNFNEDGSVPLYIRIKDMEKLERSNKEANKELVPPELIGRAISFIQTRVSNLQTEEKLDKVEFWIQNHDPKAEHLMPRAVEYRDELKMELAKLNRNGGLPENESINSESWLFLYDLLTSPSTYSGSYHDIDELKRILGSVARIDRLSTSTSLQALRALRDAWDHVEVYHQYADSYKVATKVSFTVLLLNGIVISFLSQLQAVYGISSTIPILGLSFLGTLIAGYISFINPAIKWQALRVAALEIESNIWVFRTRAGPYRSSGEMYDDSADKLLISVIDDIKTNVLEGADVKSTAFYGRTNICNLYGQHEPKSGMWTSNSASSKVTPNNSEKIAEMKLDGASIRLSEMKVSNPLVDRKSAAGGSKVESLALEMEQSGVGRKGSVRVGGVRLDDLIAHVRREDKGGEGQHAVDYHYEPVQPDDYIRFRLDPIIKFYKSRIPSYSRVRTLVQSLLVIGTLVTAGLSFFKYSEWAATVSIVALALTAYLEFQGTNNKLKRYSLTVHMLESLVLWWNTLPNIDRSVVENIDRLILQGEEFLQREQQAWRSTSQAVKMLQKQTSGDAKDE